MQRLAVARVCFLFLAFAIAGEVRSETVYLRPAEALKLAFRDSDQVVLSKTTLSEDQRRTAEKGLGERIERGVWNFYVGKTGGRVDGYAVIDHERGRMEPITLMTVISPEGVVRRVEILIYRESQGSEVREGRFREQFLGKTLAQPLRVGKDIRNISGATLSARAVSLAVRRALAVWTAVYGEGP